MFAIISFVKNEEEGSRGLFWRRSRAQISINRESLVNGSCYYILSVTAHSVEEIPWQEIARVLGGCKHRILCSEAIALPLECNLHKLSCERLSARLLVNLFVYSAKSFQLGSCFERLCVYTNEAACFDYITELCRYYQSIHIVSDNISGFAPRIDTAFNELGACLTLSDKLSSVRSNDILLCFEPLSESVKGICFTTRAGSSDSFSVGRLIPPEEVYIPKIEGISKFSIASAMYELCELDLLGELLPQTLFFNNCESDIASVFRKLTKRK